MNLLTTNLEIGYKVVKGKKVFKPATEVALQRIRYRLNEWTSQDKSEFGPFAVFSDLSSAVNFKSTNGDKILQVLYEKSESDYLWKKLPPTFLRSRYGRKYVAQKSGEQYRGLDECPANTIFAARVYPMAIIGG